MSINHTLRCLRRLRLIRLLLVFLFFFNLVWNLPPDWLHLTSWLTLLFFFLSVSSQSVSFAVFLYLRSSRQLPVLQIYLFIFFTFLIFLVLINCSIFEMFRIQEFHVSKDEWLCRSLPPQQRVLKCSSTISANQLIFSVYWRWVTVWVKLTKISEIGINKVPFLWLVTVWQFRQNREK